MGPFRDLKVWQKAHAVTLRVYAVTGAFPRDEMFGLTSQMRRSAASVGANIAEGSARGSEAELQRFLSISLGSAAELEYHLILARDLGYLATEDYAPLEQQVIEVKRMLVTFRQRLASDRPGPTTNDQRLTAQ